MILALAGGVGGARLASGLAQALAPGELAVVVNVGDDFEHLGLSISPDLDTVMYTLAGIHNPETGWGRAAESWHFMEALAQIGGDIWFRLGDRDLAVHIERTRRLRRGDTLSAITASFCARLAIAHMVLPVSDAPVRTLVDTGAGEFSFQDYFVRQRCEPTVTGFRFEGAAEAEPSAPLMRLLETGAINGVVICPSNPWLSVAPMLAVAQLRAFIESKRVPVVAVSPIVAGGAIKGPAAKIMRELGLEASVLGVARHYGALVDAWVMDMQDAVLKPAIERGGFAVALTDTIMSAPERSLNVARETLSLMRRVEVR
ncbi:MAG: 2-phospho-L-lactate transferase [Betaproteobacteria bacterium RIFCSPLOWO2_12_FULL_63_13]|nr:MAG: 2-phospho-L-lactate transferase [Betaproteobacteria bacterium RIFCSPLOWO2_02_FULL_63_19]OGA45115.1 MAG: 2-phospho-L-lactate transferase [Betaproteobacteria bacterium RIFCSPLOWO2_12_FULL_63_13]